MNNLFSKLAQKRVEILLGKNRFTVIASHINPDGDAIGSSMALALGLKKIGVNVAVVLEPYHPRFNIIPGKELLYTGSLCDLCPDIFVALDCGDAERLGDAQEVLKRAKHVMVIDHHLNNTITADVRYINESASSTSQLVYEILDGLAPLDKDIASALYAGIICDTGGFRHGCTNPGTLEVCAELMSHGIPFTQIYNELMHVRTINEVNIFKKALEKLTFHAEGTLALAFVSFDDLLNTKATPQDLDGIAEFILNISGVLVAAFAYEKEPGQTKISLRSKSIDVCRVAQGFSGGGHRNAAGARYEGRPAEALAAVSAAIVKNGMNMNE